MPKWIFLKKYKHCTTYRSKTFTSTTWKLLQVLTVNDATKIIKGQHKNNKTMSQK
jgi:hypothetical protein